jgi:hypothetical protein
MRVVRFRCCARNGQRRNGPRHVQQPRQGTQRSNTDIRSNADVQGRADHAVKHPRRNLKPAVRRRTGGTAAANFPARPSDNLMNVNMAPGPRVPRIKNFANIGIVGVPSPRCTTTSGRTRRWETEHRHKRAGRACKMEASHPARLCRWDSTNTKPVDSRYDRGTSGGQIMEAVDLVRNV